jgi:uncharacterized membrane protein
MANTTRSRERALWLIVLALGALLRVSAMWKRVLLGDEVNIANATAFDYGHLVTHYGGMFTQPAYAVLARLCREALGGVLGVESALRLPALIFGLLGILALGRLVRRLAGPSVALWAGLAVAVHPYHVFYSQMAVTYAMAFALCVWSTHAFLVLAEGPTWRRAGVHALATMLAIYSHAGCLGIVASQALMLPFVSESARSRWRAGVPLALSLAAGAGAGLALYVPVIPDMLAFREQWTGEEFELSAGHLILVGTAFAGGSGLVIYAYWGAALCGLGRALSSPALRRAVPVILLWPVGVIAFYWFNRADHQRWAYARFLFVALPALMIPAALTAEALWRTLHSGGGAWKRVAAGALLALLGLVHVWRSAEIAWGPKDTDWPAAIAHMEENLPPGTLIVHTKIRTSSFDYYRSRRCRRAGPRTAGIPKATRCWS